MLNGAPLFAILGAFFLLRESPSWSNVLGAICIVVGFVVLSWRGATKTWRTADLIFPLAGALLFALKGQWGPVWPADPATHPGRRDRVHDLLAHHRRGVRGAFEVPALEPGYPKQLRMVSDIGIYDVSFLFFLVYGPGSGGGFHSVAAGKLLVDVCAPALAGAPQGRGTNQFPKGGRDRLGGSRGLSDLVGEVVGGSPGNR